MTIDLDALIPKLVALHPEGVDRNMICDTIPLPSCTSPSTRRAWIEIAVLSTLRMLLVSPSTRRAWIEIAYAGGHWLPRVVALHPEGVDRNAFRWRGPCNRIDVALHPEGVDRNRTRLQLRLRRLRSPSTRRAWIEIFGAG